jgi:hypothetical protein
MAERVISVISKPSAPAPESQLHPVDVLDVALSFKVLRIIGPAWRVVGPK